MNQKDFLKINKERVELIRSKENPERLAELTSLVDKYVEGKTMKPARQNEIALHIWCYVATYFARFINADARGVNFPWKEFPRMAQNRCVYDMWALTGLKDNSKNPEEELEFIRIHSKIIAENLVEEAGL